MHIAYLSPMPPDLTGVSDYSAELLPHLGHALEVDVFTSTEAARRNNGADGFVKRPYDEFLRQGPVRYDHVVYHLGNSPYHVPAYDALMRWPGVVVLHDLNISGIIGAKTLGRGRRMAFLAHLARNEGVLPAARVAFGVAVRRQWPDAFAFNLNRIALQQSTSVIVHNRFMYEAIREVFPAKPVFRANMPIELPSRMPRDVARAHLGLNRFDTIIGSFGVVAPTKRIHVVIASLAPILAARPNVGYVLVGRIVEGYDMAALARRLGARHNVILAGHVDKSRFHKYMSACDVCVNLRHPSSGETSATLLRAMGLGLPTVVSDYNQYREYPDACCLKVPLGRGEATALRSAIERLLQDAELRRRMGRAAAGYVRRHHSFEEAVPVYLAALAEGVASWQGEHRPRVRAGRT